MRVGLASAPEGSHRVPGHLLGSQRPDGHADGPTRWRSHGC